jgi:hypothetical protein
MTRNLPSDRNSEVDAITRDFIDMFQAANDTFPTPQELKLFIRGFYFGVAHLSVARKSCDGSAPSLEETVRKARRLVTYPRSRDAYEQLIAANERRQS